MYPTMRSRNMVNVTTNKTLATTDAGTVQNVTVDGLTITLPAAASGLVGLTYVIRNGGNNGDVTVTVTPNSADGMNGLGFTSAVGKGAQDLKATSEACDEITVVCSGVTGTSAWYIVDAVGVWTRLP